MIDDHVTTLDDVPAAECYVIATDGWFSGWGFAEGKYNILIIPCSSNNEAKRVKTKLRHRDEMHSVTSVKRIEAIPDKWFAQLKVASDVLGWAQDRQPRPAAIPSPSDILDALRYPRRS